MKHFYVIPKMIGRQITKSNIAILFERFKTLLRNILWSIFISIETFLLKTIFYLSIEWFCKVCRFVVEVDVSWKCWKWPHWGPTSTTSTMTPWWPHGWGDPMVDPMVEVYPYIHQPNLTIHGLKMPIYTSIFAQLRWFLL